MFQSTPLREGRLGGLVGCLCLVGFNPRPCARGDTPGQSLLMNLILFQSTPLREGRHGNGRIETVLQEFQSTPLREGRLMCKSVDI